MTNTTNTNLSRANRIAVQTTEFGYKADFYRTHKKLATMHSEFSEWVADETMNKTAQREDFRKYAMENAHVVGILWDPADKRTEANKRVPKYENDDILIKDCIDLLWDNLWNLNKECGLGLEFGLLSVDNISPMYTSAKGTDLSTLGISEGKYTSTGNWAWAEIEMTLTLSKEGQEIYYMTKAQLVSGQLKKPHITKTAFTESLKESLKEAGLWVEPEKEAKAEKSAKADKVGLGDEEHEGLHMDMTAEEEAKAMAEAEEVLAKMDPKPKKTRSKKSKKEEVTAE